VEQLVFTRTAAGGDHMQLQSRHIRSADQNVFTQPRPIGAVATDPKRTTAMEQSGHPQASKVSCTNSSRS
jgi:hypothetical protein